MLSPTRVIGHKEYGNTPPGGWPGRKSDPVYDMDWRRARVANFRPTNQEEDDEMAHPFWVYRNTNTDLVVLAASGIWYPLGNPNYHKLAQARGLCRPSGFDAEMPTNEFGWVSQVFLMGENNDDRLVAQLDALAKVLAAADTDDAKDREQLEAILNELQKPVMEADPANVEEVADALADELDRRARDGDPATGPTT